MTLKYPKIISLIGYVITFSIIGCSSNTTEEPDLLEKNKQQALSTKKLKQNEISHKVDSRIASLIRQSDKTNLTTSSQIKTKESQVQVYVVVASAEENDITLLKNLGLEIEIVNTKLRKIQAWIAFNDINRIANSDNVLAITIPSYGNPRIREK